LAGNSDIHSKTKKVSENPIEPWVPFLSTGTCTELSTTTAVTTSTTVLLEY